MWAQLKQHTLIRVQVFHPTPTTCAFIFSCHYHVQALQFIHILVFFLLTPDSMNSSQLQTPAQKLLPSKSFSQLFWVIKIKLWKSLSLVQFCKIDCLIFQACRNHKVLKVSSEKWIQITFVCPLSGSHTNDESILEARVEPLLPNKIHVFP